MTCQNISKDPDVDVMLTLNIITAHSQNVKRFGHGHDP